LSDLRVLIAVGELEATSFPRSRWLAICLIALVGV
jgi:hypothetical protein